MTPLDSHDYMYTPVYFQQVFSPEECLAMIRLEGEKRDSVVYAPYSQKQKVVDRNFRRSTCTVLAPNKTNRWLFQKLIYLFQHINRQYYGFELNEVMQAEVLEYQKNGFFAWHSDLGNTQTSNRKLSMIVFLSDRKCYEGGDVEWSNNTTGFSQEQGTVTVFPSYIPHCVHPITQGIRHSLVAWSYGPPFR